MTGWTFPQIADMTVAQLQLVLEGQGPILFPRLKPQLDAAFANVSDEPVGKEKLSPVEKIIKEHHERRAALNRGETPPVDEKQKRRQEAYQIVNAYYLGITEPAPPPAGNPIEGLPAETAQAIVQFVQAGLMPPDLWARDVAHLWLDISATANQ